MARVVSYGYTLTGQACETGATVSKGYVYDFQDDILPWSKP